MSGANDSSPIVFDRAQVKRQRDRAASSFATYDFLLNELAERLADRLLDIKRSFPVALDLGCHTGQIGRILKGRGGIETLVQCDLSPAMAARAGGLAIAADEEALPFAPRSFDLVISAMSLHWVNDLPGALIQVRHMLKPNGVFLATLLGGETLGELREAFTLAELDEEGGAGQRVSPFVALKDAAGLLQRAGFALPVADADSLTVTYADPFALLADLRGMGEVNAAMARRRGFTRRATLGRMAERYRTRFAREDGRVPASFELITLTGWNNPA
jgi:SAM-dependent methyltransferase